MSSDVAVRPPVLDTVFYSWRTALSASRLMPGLFVATGAVLWPLEIVNLQWRALPDSDFDWSRQILELLAIALHALIVTPLAIAVHRFAVLNDVSGFADLAIDSARLRKFFVFALVFEFAFALPSTIIDVVKYLWVLDQGMEAAFYLSMIIAMLALFILALHVLIVFPAIAVDAKNATWRAAISDSRGNAARIVLIAVLICVPLLLTYVPFSIYFEPEGRMSLAPAAGFGLVGAAVAVLLISLYAAMASRLYLAFGRLLGRPQGLSFSQAAPT